MISKVPLSEIQMRMTRFRAEMDKTEPDWELVVFFSKINCYYFTGTMQEGMLFIPRNDEASYFVRRSYERALNESLFPLIKPMESFRDAANEVKEIPKKVYLETEILPIAHLNRFQKYFPFDEVKSCDRQISRVRSIKSSYELSLIERSGEIHRHVMEECVPLILREGMSETDLATEIYSLMVKKGHHGVARFSMFDTEMGIGQLGFGVSSIYPTYFNGPGGAFGLSPAVPNIGNRENKLKIGDLVFVDVACGVDGYHTDKTMTFMFGRPLPESVLTEHDKCVEIQDRIAEMLKPGITPTEIYKFIMYNLDNDFLKNFMGFESRRVKFLGHGIGLEIDEYPVIAEGFNEPLQEGMVLALEPKKGIADVGMVGIENTFFVTSSGGRCVTGNHKGLIPVY